MIAGGGDENNHIEELKKLMSTWTTPRTQKYTFKEYKKHDSSR